MTARDLPDFSKMLDLSALDLDLSDVLKPEDLAANIPAAPKLNLMDMVSQMKFNFTEEGMQSLAHRAFARLSGEHQGQAGGRF